MKTPASAYQSPGLPNSCPANFDIMPVRPGLYSLLEAFHMKCQSHTYSQDLLAGPCAEHRRCLSDRSRSCAGSNRPSSQLTLWTCSQTSRGHTCPPSLVVSHRSVTRSPSRPQLEAMSWPPLEQVA